MRRVGAIAQPWAVPAPPLTMVAKTVAVVPIWTARLPGSTAAAITSELETGSTRPIWLAFCSGNHMAIRAGRDVADAGG